MSVDFAGAVIAGSLPPRALALVEEWAAIHTGELTANWERARREEPLELIGHWRNMIWMDQLHDVVGVEVSGEYRLRLMFDDGTVGEVDFAGRDWRGVFEPLRDPDYFARVAVGDEAGTLAWPNGADMAPEPLYEQARQNSSHRASAPH